MPAFAAEPETRPPISRFCRLLVEPQRWRQNLHSDLGMANMQREESKHEKLEREQREREQMRQAVAAYSGPITRVPQGRTTWGWLRSAKRRPGWRMRKANGRSE